MTTTQGCFRSYPAPALQSIRPLPPSGTLTVSHSPPWLCSVSFQFLVVMFSMKTSCTGAQKVELEGYREEKIAYFKVREALINSSPVTHNIGLSFPKIHCIVQGVVRQKLGIGDYR